MPTTVMPPYPFPGALFPLIYLDRRHEPEQIPPPPVVPQDNNNTTTTTTTTTTTNDNNTTTNNPNTQQNPPPRARHPLAASPYPAKFYSQYRCAVCRTQIGDAHGADFVGHMPCSHRSTCLKSSCIRAYYGKDARAWGVNGCRKIYRGPPPLSSPRSSSVNVEGSGKKKKEGRGGGDEKEMYCQAAGCGGRIGQWAAYRAVRSEDGSVVRAEGMVDPVARREYERAKRKVEEEEKRERNEEERRRRKRERGGGCGDVGSFATEVSCYGCTAGWDN
ncbi:hypothetical protein N658DRAFT_488646 [Parathielavia hyrcaniae]|uniref:Uncharacterized protein n=1 Tax=Parathielavia hyrcaniae TaxID=113614 RepID=A0AAN6PUE5_9PEZI|nr:hypothetical protein N658DRAFT_488646 [Parathielavia hyrcaniae]